MRAQLSVNTQRAGHLPKVNPYVPPPPQIFCGLHSSRKALGDQPCLTVNTTRNLTALQASQSIISSSQKITTVNRQKSFASMNYIFWIPSSVAQNKNINISNPDLIPSSYLSCKGSWLCNSKLPQFCHNSSQVHQIRRGLSYF